MHEDFSALTTRVELSLDLLIGCCCVGTAEKRRATARDVTTGSAAITLGHGVAATIAAIADDDELALHFLRLVEESDSLYRARQHLAGISNSKRAVRIKVEESNHTNSVTEGIHIIDHV